MLAAVQALGKSHAFDIHVIDVDADQALIARYDELVPVLTGSREGGPAVEICHYFLDETRLVLFLTSGST